ncbi:MAG: hypothetical protein RRC34_05335 [Lentisphaeria bacterium]|nr:hypothetical protein [Lentisphaeria bacterium]
MGKAAWFLAVLSLVTAFVLSQASHKKIALEKADKARRLDELRVSLATSIDRGETVIRDLEGQLAGFESRGSAISQKQETLASTRQAVTTGIRTTAQVIEQLEDKHETVIETKSEHLERMEILQADITLLEAQIAKLNELLPMVKVNVEDL